MQSLQWGGLVGCWCGLRGHSRAGKMDRLYGRLYSARKGAAISDRWVGESLDRAFCFLSFFFWFFLLMESQVLTRLKDRCCVDVFGNDYILFIHL